MENSGNFNVFQNLTNAARQWPDTIAVFDEFGSITFPELLKQVNQLKEVLIAQGVSSGSSLTIVFKNSRHFIVSLYAGIGCGCVVMPLAPYQKEEETTRAVEDARVHSFSRK